MQSSSNLSSRIGLRGKPRLDQKTIAFFNDELDRLSITKTQIQDLSGKSYNTVVSFLKIDDNGTQQSYNRVVHETIVSLIRAANQGIIERAHLTIQIAKIKIDTLQTA